MDENRARRCGGGHITPPITDGCKQPAGGLGDDSRAIRRHARVESAGAGSSRFSIRRSGSSDHPFGLTLSGGTGSEGFPRAVPQRTPPETRAVGEVVEQAGNDVPGQARTHPGIAGAVAREVDHALGCLLYTSPSPRDRS